MFVHKPEYLVPASLRGCAGYWRGFNDFRCAAEAYEWKEPAGSGFGLGAVRMVTVSCC